MPARLAPLHVGGVHKVRKVNSAIAVGQAVFWNATGDPYQGTAGSGAATPAGGIFLGLATQAAGASDRTVQVLRVPLMPSITTPIADPGNAGAIPVTHSGRVAIVTAGSETRTLAAPTFPGQELLLYVKTDGGTCVITVAAAINQTGNNTITMADVNDSIRLHAIEDGNNLRWRVVCNDGAALTTV
ncbi:MAG: DUF2190 family protein [Gemmataceae bacterium]